MRLLIFTVLSLVLVGCDIPTGGDANEAAGIVKSMLGRHTFRVMSRSDRRPAVFFSPHRGYSERFVYGDYSPREQEQICAVARTVRRESATKPIRIFFYPREGDRSGLLRKEVIE